MKKVIAIDLGGTKLSVAVVTEKGRILHKIKQPTFLAEGWKGLQGQIKYLCQVVSKLEKNISAIGIGSAGPLNAKEGTLIDPTNFGWTGTKKIPLKKDLERILKKPIVFDNDAVAGVIGEMWLGKGSKNTMLMTLGTGLGVGVIANGKVLRGRDGLHPELGHLVLRPSDTTAHCECGVPGCAEGFLSGTNFPKWFARKTGKPQVSAKEIEDLGLAGDPTVLEFFDDYAHLLAQFICSLIVVSYPKEIIIAGSFSAAHPLFLKKTLELVHASMKRQETSHQIVPTIRISHLENQSGILGAAYMALNHRTYHKNH